jgi:hypothetical protein
MTHTNCTHDATKAARARCRRDASKPILPVVWNIRVKLDDADYADARFHRADIDAPANVPAGQFAVVMRRSGETYVVSESRIKFVAV